MLTSQNPDHGHRLLIYLVIGSIIGIFLFGVILWFVTNRRINQMSSRQLAASETIATHPSPRISSVSPSTSSVVWQQTQTGWQAMGTPPVCPEPVFQSPVDVSKATSILYPGQTRGGQYKPHGGFRFDTIKDNQVKVSIPLDALVIDGSRYLVNGETQYTFDFLAPCGIMYRFGHLQVLTPTFQALADQFPPPQEMDSRTTPIEPNISVTMGQAVATAIGVKAGQNTFMDFGVYDLRQPNEASKNPTWTAHHPSSLEQHAVCWFDLFPSETTHIIRSLPPGDPTSGTTSDFCQ